MYLIRPAKKQDVPHIIELLHRYTRETFNMECPVSDSVFEKDGFGRKFHTVISIDQDEGNIVGFPAWQACYDLHWGISGGEVIDMYVLPECRGYSIAPRMACLAAKQINQIGGTFLKRTRLNRRLGTR